MAEPVLEAVAQDVEKITSELERAKSLTSFLQEAGEDVSKMNADIRNLEVRKKKWERVLESRGYGVKK